MTDLNKRKRILRDGGRCYNCLRKGHLSRHCRSASKCKLCQGRHHTTICDKNDKQSTPSLATNLNPKATPYTPGAATNNTPTSTTNTFCSTKRRNFLLQTALTVVHNPLKPKSAVQLHILFDSGSQRSYLSERAMKLLRLKATDTQTLSIVTFGAERKQNKVCPIVSVGICLKGRSTMTVSLYVVPSICNPITCQSVDTSVAADELLRDLDLADPTDGTFQLPVDLLIGCDYYWGLVTGSICRTGTGPTAKLGWVLSGPTSSEQSSHCSTNLVTTHISDVESQPHNNSCLEGQLQLFWDIKSLGILETEATLYDTFCTTLSLKDGRYEVTLLWREHHKPLPSNYQLCERRLVSLLRCLRKNPVLLRQYNSVIQEQIQQGIVEPVPEVDPESVTCHYLPRHAVIRSDKTTTKLRVVYDATTRQDHQLAVT